MLLLQYKIQSLLLEPSIWWFSYVLAPAIDSTFATSFFLLARSDPYSGSGQQGQLFNPSITTWNRLCHQFVLYFRLIKHTQITHGNIWLCNKVSDKLNNMFNLHPFVVSTSHPLSERNVKYCIRWVLSSL